MCLKCTHINASNACNAIKKKKKLHKHIGELQIKKYNSASFECSINPAVFYADIQPVTGGHMVMNSPPPLEQVYLYGEKEWRVRWDVL